MHLEWKIESYGSKFVNG